ncbi:hypothetical protein ABPG73_006685 [Tetrahymena malaccensis]
MAMQKFAFLLAITFYIFHLVKGNQQINNCEIQQIVYSDPQHLNPYLICTECQQGYIVNYDFKSCIKATSLPLGIYQFCKRLDRNKYCDEALCTIQIDQNELFVSENPYQYDPRCAKIDTINQICISPRFPYTLDIATNQILHYVNRFCKIQNGNPNNNGLCKCPEGQAVDSTGSQCLDYQNCQVFGYANQIKYCIQCKQGYFKYPYQTDCTLRCIEDNDNQICKYCFNGVQGQLYYGQFCDTQVDSTRSDSNCQITNSSTGDCVQCKDSFFYSLIDKQCKQRQRSAGCLYLNPIADQCLTLQCSQQFQISDQLAQILWQKIPKNQKNSQFSDPQNAILFKYYLNLYFAQPDTIKSGYFQYQGQLIQIFSQIDMTNLNLLTDIYYNNNNNINSQLCEYINYFQQVTNCKTFFAGLCIECQNTDVYYQQISTSNVYQNFQNLFISFCGQSEDQYIPNCKVISGDLKSCLLCKEGYIFNNNQQCVPGNVLNCILYDSQGNCLICKQQYVLSSNKCYFISKNCASYSIDSNQNAYCTACKDTNSFYLVLNSSQKVCTCQLLNPQVYQPCKYKADGNCQQCDQGTTLNSSTQQCDINQILPYYCIQPIAGINSNLCNQCQDGYVLDKQICFPQKGSCSQYKPSSAPYQNICDYQNNQNQLCKFTNQQGFYLAYDSASKSLIQQSCNITNSQSCFKCFLNKCLDTPDTCDIGQGWSKTFNKCFAQCLDDKLLIDPSQVICNYKRRCDVSKDINSNMFQCSDCRLVSTLDQCFKQQQNIVQCDQKNNYFFQKGLCMYYCGNGKISYEKSQCQYSQLCQEGLTWSDEYSQCVYKECKKNIIAINQSCLKQEKIEIKYTEIPDRYRFSQYYVGLAVILVFLIFLPIFYLIILKMVKNLHQKTRALIKELRKNKEEQEKKKFQYQDKNIQTSGLFQIDPDYKIEVPTDEQNITGFFIVQSQSNNIPSIQNIAQEAPNKQIQLNEQNNQLFTENDQDVGSPSNLIQIQTNRRQNSGSFFNCVENQT